MTTPGAVGQDMLYNIFACSLNLHFARWYVNPMLNPK